MLPSLQDKAVDDVVLALHRLLDSARGEALAR
jgi:hypothetical protein